MTAIELRKNFHNLIDSIDNERILLFFYDLMKTKSSSEDVNIWNHLSDDQKQELISSAKESENPTNLVSNDETKAKFKKWL
jgi:hypothetical protein